MKSELMLVPSLPNEVAHEMRVETQDGIRHATQHSPPLKT